MISTRTMDLIGTVNGDKRTVLLEMIEGVAEKYAHGVQSHGMELNDIPNIDEFIHELQDMLAYATQYKRSVIRAIVLIDQGNYQEARNLLSKQMERTKIQKELNPIDPGFKHDLELASRDE